MDEKVHGKAIRKKTASEHLIGASRSISILTEH
jgi:hypothetical protein